MRALGGFMLGLSIILTGVYITYCVYANFNWENNVYSNWTLSDKSSTLQAKSDYMDKFVLALQSNNLADNSALIWKTADTDCQKNVDAVKTLRDRLTQIKGMDETSFQYQQAIQQITAQEQGQADGMIATLHSCYQKTHYYLIYNPWLFSLTILSLTIMMFFGIVLLIA